MHTLLERQLRTAGFSIDKLPDNPAAWQEFLVRIERSYINAERERERLQKAALVPHSLNSPTPLPAAANAASVDELTRLKVLMSALSHGVCGFDEQGSVLFVNPAAQRYLGALCYQRSAVDILEAFVCHDVQNPQERLTSSAIFQSVLEGYAFHDLNATLCQAGEIVLPVALSLDPVLQGGQVKCAVLLFSDSSETKKVEAELLAAKDSAEQASRAKSHFLSSMSHELRTPMNAILGYGELLKEDLATPLEEFDLGLIDDLQGYVSNILHAGWHLLDLINKVLDLSRIEAGKMEILIDRVNIVDLIKECTELVKPLMEKRQLTLCDETYHLSPHFALIDRARLKQVIINLLSNAVKYNRDQGSITVRLTQPSIEYVKLEIIDTGIGLTPEEKAKVFEPFTRMNGVNLIEGTGIGLTITKKLLHLMDAKIDLSSEKNVGSNFWIELPTGEVSKINPNMPHRKYIMLYIEDSRSNVSLVAQILKVRPDIALLSAHTGEVGLELAKMHCPDLILLDINLPGMDGFEVMRHLRQDEKTQAIPVIALSAVENTKILENSHIDFLRYIVKPLDIKNFLEAVDLAISQSAKGNN